VEGQ